MRTDTCGYRIARENRIDWLDKSVHRCSKVWPCIPELHHPLTSHGIDEASQARQSKSGLAFIDRKNNRFRGKLSTVQVGARFPD